MCEEKDIKEPEDSMGIYLIIKEFQGAMDVFDNKIHHLRRFIKDLELKYLDLCKVKDKPQEEEDG